MRHKYEVGQVWRGVDPEGKSLTIEIVSISRLMVRWTTPGLGGVFVWRTFRPIFSRWVSRATLAAIAEAEKGAGK